MDSEIRMKKALIELLESGEMIGLRMEKRQLWLVFVHLQLALRHPEATGPSSEIVRKLALQMEDILAPEGDLRELAELGWYSEYDVSIQ